MSCPAGAEFRVETNAAGGGRAFGYFDRLGRDVRMSTVGFDGTHIVDTEYDALGRVSRKSEPYYAGAPVYWTSFTYDILGRVTQTTHPDNSTSATAFNGFTTVATNQLSQTRTETKNAMGDLVRTEDHLGGYVDFTYDHQGNLTRTEQGGPGVTPVVTTITYDLLGRKIAMADPDMGNWTYEYNAFGELVKQTTAKGDETLVAHDLLGRMVRRLDNDAFGGGFIAEADANWLYDTAVNGLGQLASEETDDGGATPPLRRMFEYDALGRTSSVHTHIVKDSVTESYQQRTTYDEFGRVFQQYDGADVDTGVEYYYNPNGYLEYAIEAQNSANQSDEYYRVLTMDARGNVTQLRKRGVTVTTAYHAARGTMNSVHAQDVATTTLQDLSFTFDAVGNLTAKTNQNRTVGGAYRDLTESYNYDHLNRLTSVTQGTESLVMDYDALGNLTSKSDVGAYTYGSGAGPHAVTSAGGQTYVYDANGNQVSGDGRTIGYTVFNKPNDITRGARDVDVAYGPNRNRYARVDNEGQSSEVTTHYIGSIERIWRASGVVETKRYIDGEVIVTVTDTGSGTTESIAILLKDHLGSTDLIVDDAGQIVQAQSFDPWGKRRAPDYASLIGAAWYDYDNSATTRGFTGHEQLDPVGLVHMNGRVYDPKLGRFLSADPFIQAPANTQSYNRYTYVFNNPLSYTDPSGFAAVDGGGMIARFILGSILKEVSERFRSWLRRTPNTLPPGTVGGTFSNGSRTPTGIPAFSGQDPICERAEVMCADADGKVAAASAGLSGSDVTGWNFLNGAMAQSFWTTLTSEEETARRDVLIQGWRDGSAAFRAQLWPVNRLLYDLFIPVDPLLESADALNQKHYLAMIVAIGSIATRKITKPIDGVVTRGGDNLPVPFDGEFATKQLLGTTKTPGGRDINFHAADRMVNPPRGRRTMTPAEVDQVLDGATNVCKRTPHPQGNTLTIQNRNLPGRPQVVVDEATGTRVITVINPK